MLGIEDFCRRWEIVELALFGSLARGDFRADSDADVLVTFRAGANQAARDHFAMTDQLRELFGRKVDLVEERLITNPFRRHNILLDKKILFSAAPVGSDQIRDGANRIDRDITLIWDIVKTGREINAATEGKSFDDYKANRILCLAVERLLITIGEASHAFSEAFRAAHPEIPWSDIIGERNILVHRYTEIKDEEVWRTATVEVPRLVSQLQPLLPASD